VYNYIIKAIIKNKNNNMLVTLVGVRRRCGVSVYLFTSFTLTSQFSHAAQAHVLYTPVVKPYH